LNYVNLGPTLSVVKDDTPWLDEQENRIWRSFLHATGRISRQLSDSLKEQTALTMDDYEVLVHLSEADPHRVRMTELSHRLLHSQSRLTQRIDRLAKRGLVCREKCADDGRGTFAVLTNEGLKLIVDAAPQHVRDVRAALIDLIEPSERAMVADVLERLATAAREADGN
jgi:DNA-binding MarR family transcriptional regulator